MWWGKLWKQPALQALKARNIPAQAEGLGKGMAERPTSLPKAGAERAAKRRNCFPSGRHGGSWQRWPLSNRLRSLLPSDMCAWSQEGNSVAPRFALHSGLRQRGVSFVVAFFPGLRPGLVYCAPSALARRVRFQRNRRVASTPTSQNREVGYSAKRSADPDIESFEHPPPTRPAKNKSA